MDPKNIANRFSRTLLLTICMIIPLAVTFMIYIRAEKRIVRTHEMRFISFNLAEELHQSSDNLTRMARTYVITGESRYKQQYLDTLDIRNGKKPRPEMYSRIYWDLVLEDDKRPRSASQELVPLLELMRRNGFTEQELAKLTESKQHSDQLALLELEAMSLAETSGPGAEAKRASAVVMLHDLPYHQAKAAIMKPINDFFVMVDKRTQEAVAAAARLALLLRVAFVAFALWLVFMLRWTFKVLNETLGGSIEEVYSQIARLVQGDFTYVIPGKDKKDNSIMGWLAETQTRLSVIEQSHTCAEEALKRSEHFFKESQRSAAIGSYHADFVADTWESSEVLDTIFGIDKHYHRNIPGWLDIVHPDDREMINRYLTEEIISRQEPFSKEYRIIRKNDGETRYVSGLGEARFDSAGTILSLMGTVQDITEHKKIEDNLRKMSRAVEQSPVTIIITDTQGTIEFVNPRFTELTGYSAEDAVGQNPRLMKSGQTPPEVYNKLWPTISSGNVWSGEFLNKSKDGTLFWEHATISPLRDSNGAITHYLAIKEDITEKKNIMNQLLQSQKIESIGQLVGGLAHDFNNILCVISGFAVVVKLELGKDHNQIPHLDQILKASSKAGVLTHSLLAYCRKQVMVPEMQNLNTLLSNVGSFIVRLIGEDIELNIAIKNDPLMVYVDRVQIEQVLLNLATNARDAMPDGGAFTVASAAGVIDEKYIHSHGYGEAGSYAVISVTDTGCGMDEHTMNRIFDPFFTTKEVGKGTGLGMSMVMGIVKQHSGFIDVKSVVGTGTAFEIYLPLVVANADDAPEPGQFDDYEPEQGEGTILLAEDEESVRDYMEKLLTMFGYTVILAVDGQDAVEKFTLRKDEIQLVMLDMVMPKKSGKDAWNEIRQIDSSIKVIYFSGYAEDIIKRQRGLGPDEVLISKSVLPKELLSVVKKRISH